MNYAAAGSCVIDANQAGSTSYAAATQVQQTITVDQAPAFVLDSPAADRRRRAGLRLHLRGLRHLASLASGASAQFVITVKASETGKVLVLAAAASQNPDSNPLNNISVQQITIRQ